MKKTLLSLAFLGALTASAAVTPNPLPEGVVSVAPVQGVLDSFEYPRGVTDISVTFSQTPEVNTESAGNICIYVNGSETPSSELPSTSAYVDGMGLPMGALTFPVTYKDAGVYRVTIPEGTWLLGDAKTPSPALDLNYEIYPGLSISPLPGVVAEMSNISFSAPDGATITAVDKDKFQVFRGADDFAFTVENDNTSVDLWLDNVYTEPGNYTLFLQKGAVSFTLADGTATTNNETIYSYVITDMPRPVIEPGEGLLPDGFGQFTLTMPEGYELSFADSMAQSYVFKLDSKGNPLGNIVVKYTASASEGKVVLTPTSSDGTPLADNLMPESGEYRLELGTVAFCNHGGDFVSMPPFAYSFRIENAADAKVFVKGHVTNPDGSPAAMAFVSVTSGDFYNGALTDDNGYYEITEFPEIAADTYTVTAMDADWVFFFEGKASFPLATDNVYDIQFPASVEGYVLEVTVNNEIGMGLTGATVTPNNGLEAAVTDEMGLAIINLEDATQIEGLQITVSMEGYASKTLDVAWGDDMTCAMTVELSAVESGVSGIYGEESAVYFDLQGNRLSAPVKGQPMIKVSGKKAVKVIK